MKTFQLAIFLVSAVVLPILAFAAAESKILIRGKIVVFAALAIAARYLLGAMWVPDEVRLLWVKSCIVAWVFCYTWMQISKTLSSKRPIVCFGAFMVLPFFARFAFFGSFVGYGLNLGSIAFWAGWTVWAFFMTLLVSRKATRLGRWALAFVAIAMLSFFLSADSRASMRSYAETLNEHLRRNVVERWEPIKRGTEKIVAAWDALVEKDRQTTANGKVGVGKITATLGIKAQVAKLRKDLLTVDSRAVLERATKLDGKIASAKKALSELREKRGLNPEGAEKLDMKIAEAEKDLAALESARADAISTARRELKEIGLDLPEKSPFLTVDLGALIDNAIVARNIGFVVENLKGLVDADKGNMEAAKRYYGAYIVMLDVQAECFRQYLDKAATGIWRDGIAGIAKKAEAAKKGNEAKAAAEGRSEEEKKGFLHAAGTNDKTLKAAQAYLDILKRHEDIVREKLAAAEKRHEVALSFRESVDIASTFGSKAVSDMSDFTALLELKLPEMALFDDVAMKAEFDAITKKLMKE